MIISPKKQLLTAAFTMAFATSPAVVMAQTVRDYLLRALDTNDVSGEIKEPLADRWKQSTGSTAPVMIHVVSFSSPLKTAKDCRLVKADIYQDGIPTQNGKPVSGFVPLEMTLCRGLEYPPQIKWDLQTFETPAGKK